MGEKDGKKSVIFLIIHLIGVIGIVSYLLSGYKVEAPKTPSKTLLESLRSTEPAQFLPALQFKEYSEKNGKHMGINTLCSTSRE